MLVSTPFRPDNGPGGIGFVAGRRERTLVGLAATYSPASWDAVPSAPRRLTAEFGMGSGVSLALMPPNLQNARGRGRGSACFRIGSKPVGRLVPVS